MDRPRRFFECLIPETVCNLECDYCYVIQENRRTMKLAKLKYPPDHIIKALDCSRVGGICWISICGAGETFAQPELIEIVKGLLECGHYINITTNGTLTKRIRELVCACKQNINHLHFAFSLHYLELQRKNLLDSFFENVKFVHASGASFVVQMNLYDKYLPYIDEIKELCLEKIGAYPQVALTRDESVRPMKILTEGTIQEYFNYGEKFDSPLFRFTYQNFNKKRSEFCYAGEWSGVLNLATGWLSKCYMNSEGGQNIFEDISKPISFEAVGKHCNNCYCVNSSHFMSLGVIPSIHTPSYVDLRNRENAGWYTSDMKQFLGHKLSESNVQYGIVKRIAHDIRYAGGIRGYMNSFWIYRKMRALKEKIKCLM